MVVFSEAEKIKYDIIPEIYKELRRLQSDNSYLIEKIAELEERLKKLEQKDLQ